MVAVCRLLFLSDRYRMPPNKRLKLTALVI